MTNLPLSVQIACCDNPLVFDRFPLPDYYPIELLAECVRCGKVYAAVRADISKERYGNEIGWLLERVR